MDRTLDYESRDGVQILYLYQEYFIDKKVCIKCKLEKLIKDFPWKQKSKGIRHSRCFTCHREYQKEYYYKNKKRCLDNHYKRREIRRKKVIDFINEEKVKGCTKCSEKRIPAIEFHHKDPAIKDNNISSMLTGTWSLDSIKKELKKCLRICSNCHRVLHWELRIE